MAASMKADEYVVVTEAGQAFVGDEFAGPASVGQSSGHASEQDTTPGPASVGVDDTVHKIKDKKRKKSRSM